VAGHYAAGALLMPVSRLKLAIEARFGKSGATPVSADSSQAVDLRQRGSEAFAVSQNAARIRLS
jgi:hypothetical protein